jgi:hypothetical protein
MSTLEYSHDFNQTNQETIIKQNQTIKNNQTTIKIKRNKTKRKQTIKQIK